MKILSTEVSHGVRLRVGTLAGDTHPIPVALWTPEEGVPRMLIAVGHGASGHKMEDYVVALARQLVRHHQAAVFALDGPNHGERNPQPSVTGPLALMEFAQRWSSDGTLTDVAVAEWRWALDEILEFLSAASDLAIGYWGLSMGTILGLPLVAAEPRISAAVLGLMGATGPTRERIVSDAASLTPPIFFLGQWDDELFPRASVVELFGLIGSRDKTLVMSPGPHSGVSGENFRRSVDFLADRLLKVNSTPH
ncbi:MAG: alpha/beta hydrolase [Actinomycetota bacterium]|jgi:pimeloyl-ACP methyl ester carboxylesterase